jgi:ribosome-associated protein
MDSMVQVTPDLEIPDEELVFTTSRSGGRGGQNVNKVSTRVTLRFDVENSPSLSSEMRSRLREQLAGRINRQGVLRVTSQRHRSQHANKEAVVRRFAALLREALEQPPARVPTEVPAEAEARRLEEKRRRSQTKRERSAALEVDE